MATIHMPAPRLARDHRFFLTMAIVMALTVVSGFSLQFLMGRSSFGAPLHVHFHAVLFMGWTAFYVLQNALIATNAIGVHRRLGRVGAALIPLLVAVGIYTTILMVRNAAVPIFFRPAYFLVMNPVTVLTFAGLAIAAIMHRRRTEWHRRLMYCGMALLLAPAFGRLLPAPLLIPYAGWWIFGAVMLFPIIGAIADKRRRGRVHPAWWWGMGTMLAAQILMDLIVASPAAPTLYAFATAGSPGASVAPFAYPPFPPLP